MEKIKHRFLSWAIGVVSIGVLGVVGFHSEGIAKQPNPPGQQAGRFVALPNGEVLDVTTGLRWQQEPGSANVTGDGSSCNGPTTTCVWQEAVDYCDALGGGYRLPEVKELISLVDYSLSIPALPAGHPFSNVQSSYWSATTLFGNSTGAWRVNFGSGVVSTGSKVGNAFVWCARSGS